MSTETAQAEIAIIGGSGFYEFIENGKEFEVLVIQTS